MCHHVSMFQWVGGCTSIDREDRVKKAVRNCSYVCHISSFRKYTNAHVVVATNIHSAKSQQVSVSTSENCHKARL